MAEKNTTTEKLFSKIAANSNAIFAMALIGMLATLLIPLPNFVIDLLLTCSICLGIMILIITLAAKEAMEISTFPSILLITTLFRLCLNVATTKQILLQGNAGSIIDTFGSFVAGGNIIVGMVIFLILVIIQFVVITKGSERISEVGARFTLDAMPGKQMAIDADLNAGNITDKEARARREKIVGESEFYGAMDGASKFIRGDAMAGMIITAINLIGGIIIGYSKGMTMVDAMTTYSILSMGDGLVSQIPSIIISISSGFLVTKTRSSTSVSQDLTKQLFTNAQPLFIASAITLLFGLVPGFPKIPFMVLGVSLGYIAWSKSKAITKKEDKAKKDTPAKHEEKAPVEQLLDIDIISVQVGVRLIEMVDPRKKSSIFERIGAIRRKFAQQLGIIIPLVRLRDNINLPPNSYEIRLFDHAIATGTLEPGRFLAMDSGNCSAKLNGIETKEPVYGLDAIWIAESDKETAEINGYTVIDPESVLITHISETLSQHAHELLTREDVQQLVDRLRKIQPSLVGDVVGELVSVGLLQRVLQTLLRDNVSIRDLPQILESLSEHAPRTKNAVYLTEFVRKAISRPITELYKDQNGSIIAISLDPELEHTLVQTLKQEGENMYLGITPDINMQLINNIAQAWRSVMEIGYESVILLCDSRLRRPLADTIARAVPRLPVVAYDEITVGTNIQPVKAVTLNQQQDNKTSNPAPAMAR